MVALPVTATLPEGTPSSLSSVQVWPVASFSSWKMRSVRLGGFVTEIGPWMSAIVPGPPVEPMLTVASALLVIFKRLELISGWNVENVVSRCCPGSSPHQ